MCPDELSFQLWGLVRVLRHTQTDLVTVSPNRTDNWRTIILIRAVTLLFIGTSPRGIAEITVFCAFSPARFA